MSDSGSASGSRPDDELVDRFAGALSRRARAEIDALVDVALEEAREEVGAALRSAVRRELVTALLVRLEGDEPVERSEPAAKPRTPHERGTHGNGNGAGGGAEESPRAAHRATAFEEGCYLYAITRADTNVPGGVRGVEGGHLRAVDLGPLRAVVSAVDTTAFDEKAFADRLGDPEWVERKVRAHDDVLRRLVFAGPVIPLRFGTIVATEQDVRRLLEDHLAAFGTELDRLQGAAEWGVKGYWPADALLAHLSGGREGPASGERGGEQEAAEAGAPSAGDGTSYLLDRQRERETAARAEQVREGVLDTCHKRLTHEAREAVLLPVPSDRATDESGALVLNASYLVAHDRLPAFQSAVGELSTQHAGAGLVLETTGPWPPYSFVAADILEREGA